jgi:succinate dehydrogenase / fumarate reductase cytochrome b subunit
MPSPATGATLAPVLTLTRTLIGKKVLMAVSGVVLLAYVVLHMLGNLKVFQGREHLNAYAEGLRAFGAPFFGHGQVLWIIRIGLLAALAVHVWSAWLVTRASWKARPEPYHRRLELRETTYAARTMRWGGVIILLYVVYHLLDLTLGPANPGFVPGDVYRNLVASFQRPAVVAFYIAANLAVGLHVYHGLWSGAQTMGMNRQPTDRWRRSVAAAVAGLLTLGYVIVPLAVLFGIVR